MALNSVPQTQSVPKNIIEQCVSAGSTGNIEELYGLIKEHPRLLDEIDSTPFLETPLHKAAAAGHVPFAVEIMALKPSFSRKLNGDGLTPLHLALEEISKADPNLTLQQIQTEPNQALQQTQPDPRPALQQTQSKPTQALRANLYTMVFCLLDFDKDLARVKGKELWTLLHYAARIGDLELLIEILIIYPEFILDLTSNGKTALNIALNYEKDEAFFMLYNWIYLTLLDKVFWGRYKLKNWRCKANDEILKANTETPEANDEISKAKISKIKKDLSKEGYERIVHILCCDPTIGSSLFKLTKQNRNALMVVVTLFLTINFQVLLTPPGGTWQDNMKSHLAGTAIMGKYFARLSLLNYASLCFSVFAVIFLLPRSRVSLLCFVPLGFLFGFFSISRRVQDPNPEGDFEKFFKRDFFWDLGLIIIFSMGIWFSKVISLRTQQAQKAIRFKYVDFSLRWRSCTADWH